VIRQVTADGRPIAEDAKEEIRVHALLCSGVSHPHIVKLHDVQEDETKIYTVLEYCAEGDFFSFVKEAGGGDYGVAIHFFRQLMQGMDYLHNKRNISHRDMSLENLLLTEAGTLKICDFGVAVESEAGYVCANQDASRRTGKTNYMAPEVFSCQPYCPRAADVWSCGVILFIMLVEAFPYELPLGNDQRFRYIFSGRVSELLQLWKKQLPADAIDLLNRMLSPQNTRITIAEVLLHPLLAAMTDGDCAVAAAGAAAAVKRFHDAKHNCGGGGGGTGNDTVAAAAPAVAATATVADDVNQQQQPQQLQRQQTEQEDGEEHKMEQ
jgi:serine/threonine-protein kinase HSL1 (negative regulator of Swe1 kinase)